MKKIFFLLIFVSFPSLSNECFSLIENHRYELKGGAEYCLEVNYQYVHVANVGTFETAFEISDYAKENYELVYSNETIVASDIFWISSFDTVNIIVIEGIVYVYNTEKKIRSRMKRSVIKALKDGAAGSAGAALAGGESELAPVLVGAGIGSLSSIYVGPVLGNVVAGYVTTNIIKNKDKPRPPLTRIDTSKGIEGGAWSRATSRFNNTSSSPSLAGHSRGGNTGSCGLSCH
ncbi:hypothetical protein [Aliivibrio fischeri]|uniref:hypothetical protein n=1 Tax=Aliivibrio fischeri TaxID=668 RepID=UPI00080E318C|nr:hypothetical protein [Aliivibrio fischeri]OCH44055.1 hypothetical protein A6E02_03320 [Aliivibrio fischeri]